MKFRDAFIQAIGLSAVAYILLYHGYQLLGSGDPKTPSLLQILLWPLHHWAVEIAIALGVIYLMVMGFIASRK